MVESGMDFRQELTDCFGEGLAWRGNSGSTTLWTRAGYDLLWVDGNPGTTALRSLWRERKQARPAQPLILLAAAVAPNLRIVGPQEAQPVRELSADRILPLLQSCRDAHPLEASAFLGRELRRLEECVLPGLRVKELLTPHFIRERLRWSEYRGPLLAATAELPGGGAAAGWRDLLRGLGYRIEELPQQGYLLRGGDESPLAVVHPFSDAARFSRLNDNGELPEGLALADCRRRGARWAILAAGSRLRIFQDRPPTGAATGHYLELDTAELPADDRFYLGLLAPASLQGAGLLERCIEQSKDFGEELRRGLEERLIAVALPNLARGLGEYREGQGVDLNDRQELRRIEAAALTLVFRFVFLLHTEARGYLPVDTAAYRPYSARQLAGTCLVPPSRLNRASTRCWDSLRTLVRMVRNGDVATGVPAYNGSLFAAAGFPGGDLLEQASIADPYLAPALAAITYESDEPDAPGLDYAGLQVGHLGAIYEALLSLRLARAREDLVYDAKSDRYRPGRAGEAPAVSRAQLYYQTEAGGRKAGGVYYTRQEFVRHLLHHSLLPALESHLQEVAALARRNPAAAVDRLFDFSVVDPAMGSAHFLTAALDLMADRIARFLADVGGLPGIAEQFRQLTENAGPDVQPPEAADLLRRLILKRCIYGVDVSPMAVEVANVTLWLSSFVPGLALSWLGSNLKCGDALIGVANAAVVGSDNSAYLTGLPVDAAMQRSAQLQRELAAIPDRTPAEVKESEELSARLQGATAGLRDAFNLWAAEPLGLAGGRHTLETGAGDIVDPAITPAPEVQAAIQQAGTVAERYRFFHWPLEFPQIFHRERPGFDVVVGNPPWNEVTVEELRFYLLRDPGLRGIADLAQRRRRIAELDAQNPEWRGEFTAEQQRLATARKFFTTAGGYQLQGVGDKDLYQLFCERYSHLLRPDGRLGVVLPRTAFLAEGSRDFRRWLFGQNTVGRVDYLMNSGRWAFDMEPRYTVALLAGQRRAPAADARLQLSGPAASLPEFEAATAGDGVSLTLSALGGAYLAPMVPSQRYADVWAKLRQGVPFDQLQNPEIKKFLIRKGAVAASHPVPYAELHETQQRPLFSHPSGNGLVPVWKGRSFGQYEPHGNEPAGYGNYAEILNYVQTRRSRASVFKGMFPSEVLADANTHPLQHCRIAFRHITNRTNSRTVIAVLVPPRTPLTNAAPYLVFADWGAAAQSYVLGVLNSLPFDWLARRYVEINMNYYILNMLCFPPPGNTNWRRIGELAARLSCVDARFADFAAAAGVEYGALTEPERAAGRAEIDALVAAAYGLTAEELAFIFTDFTENAVSPAYRAAVLERLASL